MQTSYKTIKLAVCYFMPENSYLKNDLCIPIQLGPLETGYDLGIQKDNEGDNRSDKHPFYSEYSGIYWIWKNTEADYKGMFHHRRFMTLEKMPRTKFFKNLCKKIIFDALNMVKYKPLHFQNLVECRTDEEYFLKVENFLNVLPKVLENEGDDIVVPKRFIYYHTNVREAFDEVVNRSIMKVLGEVIENEFPEFSIYYRRTLSSRKLYYSNMNVMKNSVFDDFCTFTFSVFDMLEQRLISEKYYIDLSKERSMSRVFGYIGELMMNTFILHALDIGCKVKELPLLYNLSAKGNENINYLSMRYDTGKS